jgi:hypothetical protein
VDTLAPHGSALQSGHVGVGAGFIQKHQAPGVGLHEFLLPGGPAGGGVGPILLAGPECLFL